MISIKTKLLAVSLVSGLCMSPNLVFAKDTSEPKAESTKLVSEKVDKTDPDYVKCRVEPVTGSVARKRRICLTNRQWQAAAQEGNRVADDLITNMRANSTNGQ